jgi:hypothetical protein
MSKFEFAQLVVWAGGALLNAGCFGFFFGNLTKAVNSLEGRIQRIERLFDQEVVEFLKTKAQSAGR